MYYLVPIERMDFIKHGIIPMPNEELCNRTVIQDGIVYIAGKEHQDIKYYAFQANRHPDTKNLEIHLQSLLMELTIMQQDGHDTVIDYRIREINSFFIKIHVLVA